MTHKIYTNSELAELYRQVAIFDVSYSRAQSDVLRKRVERIKNYVPNIHEYFNSQKSFNGLKLKAFGPKMKIILQLILEVGLEKAQKEILDDKILKSYHKSGPTTHGVRLGRREETPPSWDNMIKKIEE